MPSKKQSSKRPSTKKSAKKKHGKKPGSKKGAPATVWTIPIQSGGVVPSSYQNLQIGPTDSIRFSNGAGFPVNIHYTVPPLTDINKLAMGATSGTAGGTPSNQLNVTVNYFVVNSNNPNLQSGPYSVQFGNGPLLITITGGNTNPGAVSIAKGAQIQFYCDVSYNIQWSASGVWSPQPSTLAAGMNVPPQTALAGATGQNLSYTISPTPPDTQGGGTVHIGT